MSCSIRNIVRYTWSKLHSAELNCRRMKAPRTAKLDFSVLEPRLNFSGVGTATGTFDLNQFEDNLQGYFNNNSVGFGYAINQNGVLVRDGGDGLARTAANGGNVSFNGDTGMTIASVAKQITATAIMQLLQNQGQSVDETIYQYLPQAWRDGLDAPDKVAAKASIQTITFRELLTHRSGIRRIDFNGDGSASLNEQTSFAGLAQLINTGININNKPIYEYENANFALMRVMLPYLWEAVDDEVIDNAADPAGLTADLYVFYVSENVLEPMGIVDADTKPQLTDVTFQYKNPDGGAAGFAYGDRKLLAGGEGWFLTPKELAAFLANVRYNDDLLSPATRNQMRNGFLGWNNPNDEGYRQWSEGMFGTYYNHGGDLTDLHTGIMDFPNGVQVSIMVNSDIDKSGLPHQLAYDTGNNPYQLELLSRAFENAWPELVITGTAGDDVLTLRRNEDDFGSVDIFLNGELVGTRWEESLDKLTLCGVGGNDTFFIDALPGNFEVVIEGGAGSDTFSVADGLLAFYGQGKVTVNGGTGIDIMIFDQDSLAGATTYTITDHEVDKSTRAGRVFYNNIDALHVYAGAGNDLIRVHSSDAGTDVHVYGEAGNDSVLVGNRDLSVNLGDSIWVEGGSGQDSLIFDDRDGGNVFDNYVLQTSYFTQSGYGGLVNHAGVEGLTLWATNQNATINVRGTQPGQSVSISGRNGIDTVRVHATAANSTVSFLGGGGTDTMELTPDARDLDLLTGAVGFDGGLGSDSIVVHDENDGGLGFAQPGNPYTDTYTVSKSVVARGSAFADLSYLNAESIDLRTNESRNLILVNSLAATTDLTIRAGSGNDDIVVGGNAGDLDSDILGDLTIIGGAGTDMIRFNDANDAAGNDSYTFVSNTFSKTGTQTWSYLQTEQVTLVANSFNNTVSLSSVVPVDLTIHAAAGDDTIILGTNRADLIQASVHVHGSTGSDSIRINNQAAPGNVTYTLVGQSLDMSSAFFGALDYTSIATVSLFAGNGNDTLRLNSSAAATNVELYSGGGNDTIEIGTGRLDSIGGSVLVNGGAGVDSITLNDQDDLGNDVFTLTSSTVDKPGFSLLHGAIEHRVLNAGKGNNQIHINNTAFGTTLTVNAGAGNDLINVSSVGQNLSLILGVVNANGQDGSDTVLARDENFALGAANPFTLRKNSLQRNSFGGLNFDSLEQMSLYCGFGNDIVNVQEFNRDTVFALYGLRGDDTFNVQTRPSDTDTGGRLRINGGTHLAQGGDRIRVSHAGTPVVTHKVSPIDPSAGTIQALYGAAVYDIDYVNIEQVN